MRTRVSVVLLALAAGAVLLPGCGGPVMAPVKGRVTCNGKAVKDAQVIFNPVPRDEKDREPGKPGTGFTDAEGHFALSSYKPLDGAVVGSHKVTIMLDDTNPAKCKRLKEYTREVKAGDNELNFELND